MNVRGSAVYVITGKQHADASGTAVTCLYVGHLLGAVCEDRSFIIIYVIKQPGVTFADSC